LRGSGEWRMLPLNSEVKFCIPFQFLSLFFLLVVIMGNTL
jgi:hypothetical protein